MPQRNKDHRPTTEQVEEKIKKGRGAHKRKKDDPNVLSKLFEALELGLNYQDAATWAGIDPRTLQKWESDDTELAQRIKVAKLGGKVHHLTRIHQGDRQWQSSAWWLERRFRDEWSVPKQQENQETKYTVVFGESSEKGELSGKDELSKKSELSEKEEE